MAYVITEPCIGKKDASCVDVCPVDCIYTSEDGPQYYIDPDTCIDCAACESVCPVNAIYYEEDVPAEWKSYIATNKNFFRDVPPSERTFRPRTQRDAGM
jgi:NAD-dependent dihydropyrimidine dehydrogenase PreA subunit